MRRRCDGHDGGDQASAESTEPLEFEHDFFATKREACSIGECLVLDGFLLKIKHRQALIFSLNDRLLSQIFSGLQIINKCPTSRRKFELKLIVFTALQQPLPQQALNRCAEEFELLG